ncbi:MAG: hypothetical protein B6U85_07455 [Desulfurococcales archaeon ex4484_42]|nr:MAG: hypothetical protein B6U85_07455 [Desulfurococcales archaeon ex4484_42]
MIGIRRTYRGFSYSYLPIESHITITLLLKISTFRALIYVSITNRKQYLVNHSSILGALMKFSEFSYLRHYGEFIDSLLNNIDDGADEVLLKKFSRTRKGLRIER